MQSAATLAMVARSPASAMDAQSHPSNSWDEGRGGVAPLVVESTSPKEFERNG